MKRLRVLMTRQEIVPERLAGATAVVFDVFMATTTLLTILENGARNVYPVASLEEADDVRGKLDAASVLRGVSRAPLPSARSKAIIERFCSSSQSSNVMRAAPP